MGSWMRVLNNHGTTTDMPVGQYPRLSLSWQVNTCMHCENPPCLEACPAEGAIYKRPDGIVLFDGEKCTGCQACGDACPYDAIRFRSGGRPAGEMHPLQPPDRPGVGAFLREGMYLGRSPFHEYRGSRESFVGEGIG